MKNLVLFVTLLFFSVFLLGCNKKTNEDLVVDQRHLACKDLCDNLEDSEEIENCYIRCDITKIMQSPDPSECNIVEEVSKGMLRKDDCLQHKAIQTRNVVLCDDIQNTYNKDTCYMLLANQINDKTICEKIENEKTKDNCLLR